MSSVLQSLFGGSQSTANQQATSTQTNYTDPSLQALSPGLGSSLTSLQSLLQGLVSGGQTQTPAPTQQAPLSGQEQSLLNTVGTQVGPNTSSAQWINGVLGGSNAPGGAQYNSNLSSAISGAVTPTMQALKTTLSQALPGQFAAAGQETQPNPGAPAGGGSSAFDNAAALAYQGAGDTAAQIASSIGNNAYNTSQTQQTAAAGLDQNEVNNTISALNASALPRLIQQAGLTGGLTQYNTNISNLLQTLQSIGAVQAPTLAANSQSTGASQSTASKGVVPDLFKPV